MKYIFLKLMTLMFIYLKLTNAIDWNWFLVLSPGIIILLDGALQHQSDRIREKESKHKTRKSFSERLEEEQNKIKPHE